MAGDLFRRRDVSGGARILWILLLILLPYVGIFAYLLTQGDSMAERAETRARTARNDLRQMVGFSAADEIEKLGALKDKGAISDQEYATLRARLTL